MRWDADESLPPRRPTVVTERNDIADPLDPEHYRVLDPGSIVRLQYPFFAVFFDDHVMILTSSNN